MASEREGLKKGTLLDALDGPFFGCPAGRWPLFCLEGTFEDLSERDASGRAGYRNRRLALDISTLEYKAVEAASPPEPKLA